MLGKEPPAERASSPQLHIRVRTDTIFAVYIPKALQGSLSPYRLFQSSRARRHCHRVCDRLAHFWNPGGGEVGRSSHTWTLTGVAQSVRSSLNPCVLLKSKGLAVAQHPQPQAQQRAAETGTARPTGKVSHSYPSKARPRAECLPFAQELLESINTFHVAEGDTDSLQIVEEGKQEEVAAASAAEALLPPLLRDKEDEEEDDEDQSAEISTASGQPAGSCAAAVHPYVPADAFTAWPQVDLHTATLPVVASGYTTLEMLQQSTPQVAPASTQTSKERRQEENEGDGEKPRRSYVRQFSTNSTGMSGGSGGS